MAAPPCPLALNGTTKFKVALCQLLVTPDKEKNIARARELIQGAAAAAGAKLVLLPEMWNCPYSDEFFSKFSEDFTDEKASPSFAMLSEVALSQGITIVGGSIPERCGNKLYNTSCIFGSDGKLIAKHRKNVFVEPQLHLFDVDIPGELYFKESDFYMPGDEPTIVDTGIIKLLNFGEIIATAGTEESVVIAEIDYSTIHLRRRKAMNCIVQIKQRNIDSSYSIGAVLEMATRNSLILLANAANQLRLLLMAA
ncbi:hypothetical protein Syun_011617 [Stephania yunnanensis]|uniref:CN hydrolase domain-containing protein n=1 Tax=Stephania yunnanensis TaxID=152371 RepID=A0AAP0K097_9MAGN